MSTKKFDLKALHTPEEEYPEKVELGEVVKKHTQFAKFVPSIRVTQSYHVDRKMHALIDVGSLEEKIRHKSDFIEKMIYEYCKDKPWAKSILEGY